MRLKQLWEYFARYCYLPRLLDETVLLEAIQEGIREQTNTPFGYAAGVTEDGHYEGLVFQNAGRVYFDDRSVLVHPDVAQRQREEELARAEVASARRAASSTAAISPEHEGQIEVDDVEPEPQIEETPSITRYYGTVSIDAQRINREIGLVVEEVIQRLTSLTGCEVEINLEIRAHRADGFEESTVRTITENSRTLKFDHYEFE